jgi:hypothetical protein
VISKTKADNKPKVSKRGRFKNKPEMIVESSKMQRIEVLVQTTRVAKKRKAPARGSYQTKN